MQLRRSNSRTTVPHDPAVKTTALGRSSRMQIEAKQCVLQSRHIGNHQRPENMSSALFTDKTKQDSLFTATSRTQRHTPAHEDTREFNWTASQTQRVSIIPRASIFSPPTATPRAMGSPAPEHLFGADTRATSRRAHACCQLPSSLILSAAVRAQ